MNRTMEVRFKNGYKIDELKSIPHSRSLPQEQHHSGHALMFLYFAIHRTLLGERIGRRLVGRIIHHLMDVREFISDLDLTDLLDRLRLSLEVEYDRSLCHFLRTLHKAVKGLIHKIQATEKGSVIPSVRSFLIACSENEKVPSICLYPWMVAHWDEVLTLARHYRRDDLFGKLTQVPKANLPVLDAAKQERSCQISKLNQILYEHKVMPVVEREIYAFFKRDLEVSVTQERKVHEKENTQDHQLAA